MKYLLASVITLATLATGVGLYLAGSPTTVRNMRIDERRVNDLQQLQYELIAYWQSKEQLPDQLSALEDPLRGFIMPKDPVTAAFYEYRKTADLSFELCAVFTTSNKTTKSQGKLNNGYPMINETVIHNDDNWQHDTGRTCFERTIDANFFRSLKALNN